MDEQGFHATEREGHIPWLTAARKQEWLYWQRYREWLERQFDNAVDALDQSTDWVLSLLGIRSVMGVGIGVAWSSDMSSRAKPAITPV